MSDHTNDALNIILSLGLRIQRDDSAALSFLALSNLTREKSWADAESPPMGITSIIDWIGKHYHRSYFPNARETFHRQTIQQFVGAGIVLHNADHSTGADYQIKPSALVVIRSFNTPTWYDNLSAYRGGSQTLAVRNSPSPSRT